MEKSNKQVQIDFIVSCLEKADSRAMILSKISKKWQINTRTVDRLLKTAKEQHSAKQQAISKAALGNSTLKALKGLKSNIFTAIERMEYLKKVIKGEVKIKKPFVVLGEIVDHEVDPDHSDRLRAIAELNKMCGDYAPTKTDVTSGGAVLGMEAITFKTKRRE